MTLQLVPLLVIAQSLALVLLIDRLLPGRRRQKPVLPAKDSLRDTTVSVVVATLNEAARIGPCLAGLQSQREPMLEVLVVDSRSTDGTREMVQQIASHDERFQLITDDPLPAGWVGKVWALEAGLRRARGEWILGIDADTTPAPGMVAAIINVVRSNNYDAASFGPRFVGQTSGERWLQPAMLVTLIYRCGAPGANPPSPDRVMANGQCFVARREMLERFGGYAIARKSFSDDVTLARHLAANGARVGFLDGARIIDVHSYRSLSEMWREWGRSFDLKDATPIVRRWHDVAFVWLTMALPVPVLLLSLVALFANGATQSPKDSTWLIALMAVNGALLSFRIYLVYAIRVSYERHGWTFWLSWLADIPAAIRLTLSTAKSVKAWRGRSYQPASTTP
ncbi:MAG: glycosyltransferase family 2 protein [Gemmatimonadaceae bacterium]